MLQIRGHNGKIVKFTESECKMPLLNSCCVCFTPRTGTFILGSLTLISSLIVTLLCILALGLWSSFKEEIKINPPENFEVDVEDLMKFILLSLIVTLILCLIQIVVSSMLIHGLRKMSPVLMLPYMVMIIINLVFGIVINIALIVEGAVVTYAIIYLITGTMFGIYYFVVVFSHYQELSDHQGVTMNGVVDTKLF